MVEPTLLLRPGRDKSVRQRHPWIFTGSVAAVHGQPASGQTVIVRSADGEFMARAAFSPNLKLPPECGRGMKLSRWTSTFFPAD
ncbi:MAG: hypothetical protein HZB20_10185 [Chloroflexi bacterium]|nr:hypothetical protein [Chloroflexota bacterium]